VTRYEAISIIYEILDSAYIAEWYQEGLREVAKHICENYFEECPEECLRLCKIDECPNVERQDD